MHIRNRVTAVRKKIESHTIAKIVKVKRRSHPLFILWHIE